MERTGRPEQYRGRPGPHRGKRLTPDDARRLVRGKLVALKATPAETFRAELTVTAESDWNPYAKAENDDTWGLYQQNPKWWGTLAQILDPQYATESFVVGRPGTPGLRTITLTDDAVLDCWRVQGWGKGLNPDGGPAAYAAWLAHPSTQNYVRRLPDITQLFTLDRSRLDGPDKLT